MNAQARGVGFLSLSPAIYERLIKAGCDVNERFFESKQSPLHLVCTKENRRNASFLSLNFSSTQERIPTSRTWMA